MKAPWVKDALLGVHKSAVVWGEGAIGQALQRIVAQPIEPALAFSQAVGAWEACRLAAVTPLVAVDVKSGLAPDGDALAQFKAVENVVNDAQARHVLTQVLLRNHAALNYEAFDLLARNDVHLPYDLVPLALELGQRSVALREPLIKAVGLLGRWLAGLNPEWQYAASSIGEALDDDDERLWNEGSLAQREAFFKRCRQNQPQRAAEMFEAEVKNLSAKERLVFVSLMSVGLALEDEPLLNTLLSDRSKEVRAQVCMLLAHIPGSAYSEQVCSWLAPLVSQAKGTQKKTWECSAPARADEAWAKAGIEVKMPTYTDIGGERAWLLYQLVRLVPLSWWHQHTGMSVDELIAWAQKSDWSKALIQGWSESATAQDTQWICALLSFTGKRVFNEYAYQQRVLALMEMLPVEARRSLWAQLPKAVSADERSLQMYIEICPLGDYLPEDFSRMLLLAISHHYEKGKFKDQYRLRESYRELAYLFAPQSLQVWRTPACSVNESDSLREWLNDFEQIIEIRKQLYAMKL